MEWEELLNLIEETMKKDKVSKVMKKKQYKCHFDYQEVSGGAIITEYDEGDAAIVSIAEDGNIVHALGNLLYAEINEGAGAVNARVTIIIEEL